MSPRLSVSALMALSRAPFLILVPMVVLLGISTAHHEIDQLNWVRVFWVLLGALFAHVAVNVLNEYEDFRSGLDEKTERTPFSGGSGWLPSHPDEAPLALKLGVASLAAMILIGLYLALSGSPWLILLGLAGTVVIVTYTPWLNQNPWLCLMAPGTGFGLLMINGTHYALSGTFSVSALLTSLTVFFLVNNLLLLNQFPDLEADKESGRRHAVIVWGKEKSAQIFNTFLGLAYLPLVYGWVIQALPVTTAFVLALVPLAYVVGRGVVARHSDRQGLLKFQGLNVVLVNLTPLVLALGMLNG